LRVIHGRAGGGSLLGNFSRLVAAKSLLNFSTFCLFIAFVPKILMLRNRRPLCRELLSLTVNAGGIVAFFNDL